MPPPIVLVPPPDILKKYTGWFSSNGLRLAITLDGATLRLGCLSHIRGEILESWILCFSTVSAFNIGGNTEEETALNRPFQVAAQTLPGGYTVSFDIKQGAVYGVRIATMLYTRYEPHTCAIMTVPIELRQVIWRYGLANEAGKVTLEKYGDRRIITDGHTTSRFNRIHEVHPAFATEALHYELYENTLECTDAAHLVELLHSNKDNVNLCLRDVVLSVDWGHMYVRVWMPDADLLKDILRYAKEHKEKRFTVRMTRWSFDTRNVGDMLNWMEYGATIHRAIRRKWSILSLLLIEDKIHSWVTKHDFSGLDVDNVRFFPGNVCFDRELCLFQTALQLSDIMTHILSDIPKPYATDEMGALESIANDVEDWYKNGI